MLYRYPSGLADYQQISAELQQAYGGYIETIRPFVYFETVISRDQLHEPVMIRGITESQEPMSQASIPHSLSSLIRPPGALTQLLDPLKPGEDIPGNLGPRPIIMGQRLFSVLDLKYGDEVNILSPQNEIAHGQNSLRVVGSIQTGLANIDQKMVLMSLKDAQDFLDLGSSVTGLEIMLKDPNDSSVVSQSMAEKFALSVRDWQSLNRSLFQAMAVEKLVVASIIAIVAVVAGLNVLTTMFTAVSNRQRDISILRSLGASQNLIARIFLAQASLYAALGILLGITAAYSVIEWVNQQTILELPEIYVLAKINAPQDLVLYAVVSLVTFVLAIVAGLFPALMAAKVKPGVGMHWSETFS
jgi:lipoprotein-releasing system permease protein